MTSIPMVDLHSQYLQLKEETDRAIQACLDSSQFIGSGVVQDFEQQLSAYLNTRHVIGCANGTDALQIALMALQLPKGSKIIVPAFTYIAPVEVIRLLGFEPVYADVDAGTFNLSVQAIERVYTKEVKAILAVHLFGQPCAMKAIDDFAQKHALFLIEDNAQSIGTGQSSLTNSIQTTSFFPSKNLGAYGDGGAVMTQDDALAQTMRMIANHGQRERYHHDIIGINSRLDAIQAAILNVKLRHLDRFILLRQQAASFYDERLKRIPQVQIPVRQQDCNHTFHQYTIKTDPSVREGLHHYLKERQITTAIYYPLPCYRQKAYYQEEVSLPVTELLCSSVLSLPVFPEITERQLSYICDCIAEYFNHP